MFVISRQREGRTARVIAVEWIPAVSVKAVLTGLEVLGFRPHDLLLSATLRERLGDPYAAVPDGVFGEVWARAFRLRPDPALATKAAFALPFGAFGLLDHLVATATTIGEALHTLNVFLWLVSSGIRLEFGHAADDWLWVLSDPASDFVSTEWTLALIYRRLKSRTPAFQVAEVHLSRAADPEGAAAFGALWGVPVRLEQQKTGFRLAKGVWTAKNEQANPELQDMLKSLAERVDIQRFTDAPLTYAVKTLLPAALQTQAFAAEDVAQTLNLSKRTFQRKLADENVSFKELLDAYRQERALNLLTFEQKSMAEVAYSLGYEEQSSFNRAFRRWTGMPPSRWLERR